MAGSQLSGLTTANILEIEAATKAARAVLYPEDYTTNGNFSLGATNGATVMAAGLAAASPIFSARWSHATKLALIKRFTLSVGCGVTAFTAGFAQFNLFVARGFTAADTGGSSILPASNANKLKVGMTGTLFNSIRISNTATLAAVTRTKDANPVAALACGVPATAGQLILAPFAMFDVRPGEYPLVLGQDEGLVLEATVPATGVWSFGIKLDWGERDSYF